jgi:UDP-glucose 4-epimerase
VSSVWVTGGKGFIGRNLARHLASCGHTVSGIGHGQWAARSHAEWSYAHWSNAEIDSVNLTQLANVAGLPETIFHLAGGSSVGISFETPYEDFNRTVATTARLCEWIRLNAPATRLVCASSAAVYGGLHASPISENAPLTPYSPYGFHKAMMEGVCRSFADSFSLKVAVVRLFSVYGAGLEKQLIFDLCTKLSNIEGIVTLGGTGLELRDWIHVSDAVRLLHLSSEHCSEKMFVVNGGVGVGTSIRETAETVVRAWGGTRP